MFIGWRNFLLASFFFMHSILPGASPCIIALVKDIQGFEFITFSPVSEEHISLLNPHATRASRLSANHLVNHEDVGIYLRGLGSRGHNCPLEFITLNYPDLPHVRYPTPRRQ